MFSKTQVRDYRVLHIGEQKSSLFEVELDITKNVFIFKECNDLSHSFSIV